MNDGKNKPGLGHVLVGAAIGAATVTLMNKSSRKRVKESIKSALDVGDDKLNELEIKARNLKNNVKNKAVKELSKTQRKIARSVNSISNVQR